MAFGRKRDGWTRTYSDEEVGWDFSWATRLGLFLVLYTSAILFLLLFLTLIFGLVWWAMTDHETFVVAAVVALLLVVGGHYGLSLLRETMGLSEDPEPAPAPEEPKVETL